MNKQEEMSLEELREKVAIARLKAYEQWQTLNELLQDIDHHISDLNIKKLEELTK